jgi:hypothetical protein
MNEYGALVEWYWQGNTEVLGEKPVTLPLCTPQTSHTLVWFDLGLLRDPEDEGNTPSETSVTLTATTRHSIREYVNLQLVILVDTECVCCEETNKILHTNSISCVTGIHVQIAHLSMTTIDDVLQIGKETPISVITSSIDSSQEIKPTTATEVWRSHQIHHACDYHTTLAQPISVSTTDIIHCGTNDTTPSSPDNFNIRPSPCSTQHGNTKGPRHTLRLLKLFLKKYIRLKAFQFSKCSC